MRKRSYYSSENYMIPEIDRNYYDFGVIIFIALISFGVIGDAFQPLRIISLLSVPFILAWIMQAKVSIDVKKIILFFFLWYTFSIMSMLWTLDINQGLKELVYYPIHYCIFLLPIALCSKANKPKESIILGWVIVLLFTMPIGLYEIITMSHLPVNVIESDKITNIGGELVQQRYASVTFGNYNAYVVNLLYCLPFLLSMMIINNKPKLFVFLILMLFILIFIILVNGSRGGLLVSLIYLIVFSYYISKKKINILKKIIVTLLFFITIISFLYLFSNYISSYFSKILYRFGSGFSEITQDSARSDILNTGFTLLQDSVFIGQGIGSQYAALSNANVDIPASHNLFLEILIQYGILVFFGFIYMLYKIFFNRHIFTENKDKMVVYGSFIAFIPLSVINSGYLLMPSFWLFLSSIFIMSRKY